VSTPLHATVYVFLHNLLNVLVQIVNKIGLPKENILKFSHWLCMGKYGFLVQNKLNIQSKILH
jgi:hypothetical protein